MNKLTNNKPLGLEFIRTIIEASGRFKYEDSYSSAVRFYDTEYEMPFVLRTDMTLTELMQWMDKYYMDVYTVKGEEKVQQEMRKVLGI